LITQQDFVCSSAVDVVGQHVAGGVPFHERERTGFLRG
jgi:hypothetical protein